ncbi:hypothetical protein LEM8419_03241 [Neolewinella maritima]|uniref:Helix-turn-helix domain-containing protein n=1 Tax=Neolewinella maritima TaxID=1383882 RepID=A0ABN8FEG7_9BACT|nr:Fic family protein [Neolewinella maritima]CAH1002334.1 hypothetical protein LEM8419_03241 [Neolewinella maritima]
MKDVTTIPVGEQLAATIIQEVNIYLKEQEMSRTQFAEKLGVSKGYISQLLNGRSDLKLSSIANLARAMDRDPQLLFLHRRYAYTAESVPQVAEPEKPYGAARLHDKVNWEALAALPVLAQTRAMKEQVDSMRPFSRNMEAHVLQQTLHIWNYNSNAIEGNKLTYGETLTLLLYGITAKGKPLKDHLDIIGHRDAVHLMLDLVKGDRPLRQSDVRQLHQLMLKEDYPQRAVRPDGQEVFRTIHVGRYKAEPNHVRTARGSMHYFAEPNAVPGLMEVLVDWYTEAEAQDVLHPLLRATVLHHEFVAIHPFDDGNGRIGRIVMNFALMRAGYPPLIVPVDDRLDYYRSLEQADRGDYTPLASFLGDRLVDALEVQLATARGEDISGSKWDTPDDDPR